MTEPASFRLLWVSHPPHSTVHLSEAIRLAAMSTALGSTTRLLFIGEGVRSLVEHQEPYRYGPPIDRALAGLVTVECPALVHRPSLAHRRMTRESLASHLPIETVDDAGAADWLYHAEKVVAF